MKKQDFSNQLYQAIAKDVDDHQLLNKKNIDALLLHDLQLDADLFEDIILDMAGNIGYEENEGSYRINLDRIYDFLPIRISMFDRLFNRVPQKYFHKYEPVSINQIAGLIFQESSK